MPLLAAENLIKHFPVRDGVLARVRTGRRRVIRAVDGVSFTIDPGETLGLVGESGCGKTTTGRLVLRAIEPTSGRIVFDGEDIAGLPSHTISRKAIARSYQITNLLPGATVLENVRIASQSRHHNWSMLRHHRAYADVIGRARAVLADVGLAGKEDELASNLSHGEQRNLEIGIALATEPKLLCLDEPTAGMSVAETHATVDLIRRIARDLTILIVEHDMEVVMGLAHTITVLNYGEVLAEGRPSDIQANPRVQEVYLKT